MAASEGDEGSDAEAFFGRYFGESDDDSDFEGFGIEEIEAVLQNANLVREIDIEQWVRDRIFAEDEDDDWVTEDTPPLNAPFTGNPGIKVDIPDTEQPIDFFNMFFTDEMWNLMETQTNLYAQQALQNQDNLGPKSRLRNWKPVTVDELKNFIALVIAMGLTRKSDLADYWSTNEINETPLFGKIMSKNRFYLILSNFHLVDNNNFVPRGQDGHDALYKLRPFISMLNNFCEIYEPKEHLSFDEATCPFKGRVRFRVYNPAKPNKFGIKLYQVCEADSGYCVGFDIYHGDTSCMMYCDAVDLNPECTTTTKIVIGLMAKCGLLDKGHRVFLDNYYNSPELAVELDFLNTYMCGTLRKNRRGVPKAIQQIKGLKGGDGIFRRKGNMLILKYHDKRDIHMISTFHEAKLVLTDKVGRDGLPVIKPVCIVDYCKKMGGVDLSDQIIQYYDVLRKTVKWWLKLFFHLLNLLLVNSFILYKKYTNNNDKRLHIKFRMSIVRSFLMESDAPRPQRRGRKSIHEPLDRLTGRHFPAYIPAKEGARRRRPLRDCAACNVSARHREGFKRKQTSYMCQPCGVALCVPECFEVYHTKQNYRGILRGGNTSSSDDDHNHEA